MLGSLVAQPGECYKLSGAQFLAVVAAVDAAFTTAAAAIVVAAAAANGFPKSTCRHVVNSTDNITCMTISRYTLVCTTAHASVCVITPSPKCTHAFFITLILVQSHPFPVFKSYIMDTFGESKQALVIYWSVKQSTARMHRQCEQYTVTLPLCPH